MAAALSTDPYTDQFESDLWRIWKETRYPPICESYCPATGYGADREPHSSLWMAHLAEAMGNRWNEGMRLLDYGCGTARFANFMSGRLRNFTYFGVDVRESHAGPGIGLNGVNVASEALKGDRRICLDYIGSDIDGFGVDTTDVGLAASVFTHLTVESSRAILEKLRPIVNRGGIIVYTLILGDEYATIGPGGHGLSDCFSIVTNTPDQFAGYGERVGLYRTMYGTYDQTIYRWEP